MKEFFVLPKDSLPDDRGMLFVYDDVDERTYVMRNMSFGIGIVFVDADGTITEIHDVPRPAPDEDGSQQRYTGTDQYLLEVNEGWMRERSIEVGIGSSSSCEAVRTMDD